MSYKSTIHWTEASWNCISGCDKFSPGCKFCYAALLAKSRLSHLPEFKDGYFGNVILHPKRLEYPLHWRKPKRIFVNSMSDLFHDKVTDEFIQEMFAVMALCQQHIFQILSKREVRTLNWYNQTYAGVAQENIVKKYYEEKYHIEFVTDGAIITSKNQKKWPGWPLPNVWLGFSAENEEYAQKRIPILKSIPAAIKWASYEPVLGPVDWEPYKDILNWVVAGGESGPQARPANPDWYRQSRDFCIKYKIPYFFKQHGSWIPTEGHFGYDGKDTKKYTHINGSGKWEHTNKPVVGFLNLMKQSKKRTGRILDGRTWDEYPA